MTMSKRGVTELMSVHIIAQGESLDDYNLSVMTTKRRTDAWRTASGEKLLNVLHHKVQDDKHFILQWDGKMLKPLKHSAQKTEHVAVLLNCVDTGLMVAVELKMRVNSSLKSWKTSK